MKNKYTEIPILLLHGWNLAVDNTHRYKSLTEEFEKRGFKVFLPDLPGFYGNKIQNSLTLDNYVSFVKKYISFTIKSKKIILIGHSFGGRIGLKLAIDNPEKLYTIVFTGTPAYNTTPKIKIILFGILAKIGMLFFSIYPFSIISPLARKVIHKAAGAKDYYMATGFMGTTFKNIIQEELSYFLPKIITKTLIIWGKDDKIVPLIVGIKMNKMIHNSTLEIIPKARHGVLYTHPIEFVDLVEKFLAKL